MEEALNSLNIRDVYPADNARDAMRKLRSEEYGGTGKLKTYHTEVLAKNGDHIPISLYAKLVLEEYDLQEEVRQDLGRILKDAQRCRDTVKELLEFTRQTRHHMRPHDVNQAISNDVIPYIVEPFYTTKEEGQGTGLGLSLAYGIVENHGGHITVGNKPDGGAVFCITLPVATGNSEGEQGAED